MNDPTDLYGESCYLRKSDPEGTRAAHARELSEAQVDISALYTAIQIGVIRAEDAPTRALIHRLVKRLRRVVADVESDMLHLSLDGRWQESEKEDAHPQCPTCKTGLADVGRDKLVCAFCEYEVKA